MFETAVAAIESSEVVSTESKGCKLAVVWIDWYAYHVARFRALTEHHALRGTVAGLEMVGGTGVHTGLKFREELPASMPIQTVLRDGNWKEAGKWQLARSIWRHLDRLDPSAVLVPGYYTVPGLAVAVWGRWRRRRTILMTESTEHDHRRTWWKETGKGWLLRSLFDWAVAGGKPHKRYLQNLKFPVQRIAGFYDVVDNGFFHHQCQDLRLHHRADEFGLPEHYFLYVGRLAAEKNINGLFDAYVAYRRAGGSWPLVLVGDGPLRKDLEARALRSGFGADVVFEGLKNSHELPRYYAFAGCFVLPSTREPWGLVVNEAMASGLPVIVSDRCGCAEDLIVHNENGYLFDPSNPPQLTDRLMKISGLSAEAHHLMGAQSYKIICRYSPGQWAGEIARIVSA